MRRSEVPAPRADAPSARRESQVRTRRRLTESPVIGPRANTAAARVEGERAPSGRRALVGLESAPMDALGRAGRVERLTIQPRKKTHECYSKGNRRPAK